jgi:hypothetical protein
VVSSARSKATIVSTKNASWNRGRTRSTNSIYAAGATAPVTTDPFDELYIRSWRDRARYAGPELLGTEGPEALMRLPMIIEEILDSWGDVQKRASFKAEYLVTHDIQPSLVEAATVTAKRLPCGSTGRTPRHSSIAIRG